MVLQWSIVDLRVNGNLKSLEKHTRMKRRFNIIFRTIGISVSFLFTAFFITAIIYTTQIIYHLYNHPFTASFLCDSSFVSYPDSFMYAFSFAYSIAGVLMLVGTLIIAIPYIGFGLCTMYVLLWRLIRGKTGYRTHFHVELSRPLI